MAFSQNKFVLSNLLITINFFKCEKVLYFLYKDGKVSYGSFYEDKQFLNSSISTYFILFESNFVDMTLGNYDQVETANLKASLFMVTSDTVLIKHKIFDLAKETTKVAISKIWLVYYSFDMQIHQILQFGLRVKGNKNGSTFSSKSGNTILSAIHNF